MLTDRQGIGHFIKFKPKIAQGKKNVNKTLVFRTHLRS